MKLTSSNVIVACALLVIMSCTKTVNTQTKVHVQVGGNGDLDACLSLAIPRVPTSAGARLIDVRQGPGETYTITDHLGARGKIFVCTEDGPWSGVVYPETDISECGVSSPIEKRQPYNGPCKSGWIRSADIEVIAG